MLQCSFSLSSHFVVTFFIMMFTTIAILVCLTTMLALSPLEQKLTINILLLTIQCVLIVGAIWEKLLTTPTKNTDETSSKYLQQPTV